MTKPKARRDTITASEISQYAYCPISWYLRRSGGEPLESSSLKRGIAEHERAGGRLQLVARQERASGIFRLIGYFLLFAAVLLLGLILWTRI